jgi:hypothetical protein
MLPRSSSLLQPISPIIARPLGLQMEVMFTEVLKNQQKEATLNMMVRLPHLVIMVMVTYVTIRSTTNLMVNVGIHQNAKYMINLVTLLSIAHSSTPIMPRLIVPPHHKPRILDSLLSLLLLTISPVILQNYLFILNMMVLMRLSLVMDQVCVFHILDH